VNLLQDIIAAQGPEQEEPTTNTSGDDSFIFTDEVVTFNTNRFNAYGCAHCKRNLFDWCIPSEHGAANAVNVAAVEKCPGKERKIGG
jgi:hypothetical protein